MSVQVRVRWRRGAVPDQLQHQQLAQQTCLREHEPDRHCQLVSLLQPRWLQGHGPAGGASLGTQHEGPTGCLSLPSDLHPWGGPRWQAWPCRRSWFGQQQFGNREG